MITLTNHPANNLRRRGGALIAALVTLLVVSLVAAAVVRQSLLAHRQSRLRLYELQAQWLAESALERATAQLASQPDFTGETWQPALQSAGDAGQNARVEISVEPAEGTTSGRRLIAIARFPDHETHRATVRREHVVP